MYISKDQAFHFLTNHVGLKFNFLNCKWFLEIFVFVFVLNQFQISFPMQFHNLSALFCMQST
jgi:hypothetical protein